MDLFSFQGKWHLSFIPYIAKDFQTLDRVWGKLLVNSFPYCAIPYEAMQTQGYVVP